MDERHALLGGDAAQVAELLAIGRAGRGALDREVVDADRDVAAVDLAKPQILPSRGVSGSSSLYMPEAPSRPVSMKLPWSTR